MFFKNFQCFAETAVIGIKPSQCRSESVIILLIRLQQTFFRLDGILYFEVKFCPGGEDFLPQKSVLIPDLKILKRRKFLRRRKMFAPEKQKSEFSETTALTLIRLPLRFVLVDIAAANCNISNNEKFNTYIFTTTCTTIIVVYE
jgi:hypothetical protein